MVLPGKGMSWKEFFKELKNEYQNDKISTVAAAVTFSSVLALFPFLLFLVALASLIIDPAQAQVLIQELGKVAPEAVTQILGQRLKDLAASNNVGLLTIGAVGAVWAASGGVVALMDAFDTVYDVKESRPLWKVRGIAILVTLAGAVLSILASLAMVVTPAFAKWLGEPFGTLVMWLRLPVAGLIMMFVLALVYYFLPDVEQKFRFITPGSVVGVLFWLIASWGFSVYVRNFGKYDVNYGALGGVIVMLLWMYISSQVILLGAEINALLEHKSPEGKAPGKKQLAESGPAMTKGEKRREEEREIDALLHPPPPPPPGKPRLTPLAAAVTWASGLGFGVFLLRRFSR
ncbi:YihY/virulence factor BrkB family protein [Vitiosangium sp. GDMCC 1.1324]|uniref:YihY/virulence factor BrkB family protein n=1 Tax=Vitiosangium sp. (strain GDMCC 1.1324) TaxID=2138576 RepID=UPI000D36F458|nr:YihY/virulence factor BrkB family protein [Vitiosangium sp. GDMCC 1.1324]PTL76179.1 YihY/virulence factor BrkB family protein [Vitiosangium sp. GDMCC 1.1324]